MAEIELQTDLPKRTSAWVYLCIVAIFVLGTGLRLLDLTDPPLDYFPQRQLRGAIIARAIYYQLLPSADPSARNQAVYLANTMDDNEPPVFESLVALTYLVTGGEQLWVARIYAIVFWLLGGIALYVLALRMTSPTAAIAPLIYYFFLPWSVIFGRTFLPDLPMMMLTLWVAYTLYRWGEAPSWKWAILTGLLAGLAGYVKLPAVFPIILMLVGVVLATLGFKKAIKSPQVWVMAVLFIIFPAVYYLFVIPAWSSAYVNFTVDLLYNLIQPSFYIRWIIFAGGLVDLGVAFISFVGVWLLPKKARIIPLALWLGYLLYGMAFSHHIITHEYYSIPLIPAIALSLAPIAGLIFDRITARGNLAQWALVGVLVFSVGYSAWMARSIMYGKNYRNETIGWLKVGQALPKEGNLVGLTHEMGYRIAYYGWRHVTPWLDTTADEQALSSKADPQAEFVTRFENATIGQDYFVVTLFNDFNAQPMLKTYLYDHYPIYAEGDGYLIFDLTQPRGSTP
jgi:4-amino-4-deoxy-L-arabinose transferase-like glycosyltransferase